MPYKEIKLGINLILPANLIALGWAVYRGNKAGPTLRPVLVGVVVAALAGGAIGSMLSAHDETGTELLRNSVLTGGMMSCLLALGTSIIWAIGSAIDRRTSSIVGK